MEQDVNKNSARVFLCGILAAALLLVTIFFEPQAIFSNTAIYSDDYAMHFLQCLTVKKYLTLFHSCWAYDPFFLAGLPNGTLGNADNKAWEIFYTVMAPLLGEGLGFKAYVLLFFLLYPLFLYNAMRNFGFPRTTGLTAAALGILFFHLSLCINMVAWGMISYVFVCYFSLYVLSVFWRLLESPSWWRGLQLAGCFSIMVMMHILAVVHLFIPMLILYLHAARRLRLGAQVMLFAALCTGIVVNSFWLVPVIEFIHDKTTRPENYEFTLQIKNVLEPLKVYVLQRRSIDHCAPILNNTFFETVLLLFGGAGLYRWRTERRRAFLRAFAAGSLFIFAVAYYGSHTAFFSPLQPERYTIPLSLLLLVPASFAFFHAVRILLRTFSRRALLFGSALVFVVIFQPIIRPFGIFYKYKLYRLQTETPQEIKTLISMLRETTTRDGRILIEDSESVGKQREAFYGGHFPAIFPEFLKREYLCGPRPLYPVKHSYASFTNGVLFERDIASYSRAELEEMFALFNVKWIVSWSDRAQEFFSRFPDYITQMGTVDKFTLYIVNRNPSFFIKGSGIISSDYNRIELREVTPEDGEIVISYHWMKKLRAVPSGTIERVFLGGDPVGFIKVKNPPKDFAIINTY